MTRTMQACSACAGDYEDPERTVWLEDDAEDDAEHDAENDAEAETEGDAKEERQPRAEQIPVQEK